MYKGWITSPKKKLFQYRNECIPDEIETNFFDLMKSKAHILFNMKLKEKLIIPEKMTIQSGFKIDDDIEF